MSLKVAAGHNSRGMARVVTQSVPQGAEAGRGRMHSAGTRGRLQMRAPCRHRQAPCACTVQVTCSLRVHKAGAGQAAHAQHGQEAVPMRTGTPQVRTPRVGPTCRRCSLSVLFMNTPQTSHTVMMRSGWVSCFCRASCWAWKASACCTQTMLPSTSPCSASWEERSVAERCCTCRNDTMLSHVVWQARGRPAQHFFDWEEIRVALRYHSIWRSHRLWTRQVRSPAPRSWQVTLLRTWLDHSYAYKCTRHPARWASKAWGLCQAHLHTAGRAQLLRTGKYLATCRPACLSLWTQRQGMYSSEPHLDVTSPAPTGGPGKQEGT